MFDLNQFLASTPSDVPVPYALLMTTLLIAAILYSHHLPNVEKK